MPDDLGDEIPIATLADHDTGRPFKNPWQKEAAKEPLMPTRDDYPAAIFQMPLELLYTFKLHMKGFGVKVEQLVDYSRKKRVD